MAQTAMAAQRNTKNRLVHIEFLRILAIYFVMFNHTGTKGFLLFTVTEQPLLQWLYLLLSVFCRIAVPLFFMGSGAVLLGKTESYRDVYQKRIVKYGVILLLISFVYWGYDSLAGTFEGERLDSLVSFLGMVYASNISTQLWYLYAYLAFLVMLPLLRRLAQAMEVRDYLYFGCMMVLFTGVIPTAEYLLRRGDISMNENLRGVLFTSTSIGYSLIGYFLEKKMPKKYETGKMAAIALLLGIGGVLISAAMTKYSQSVTGIDDRMIAISAFSFYFAAKWFFQTVKLPQKLQATIIRLGGTTFGVYLLERILRERTAFLTDYMATGTMSSCLLWILAAMVIGMLITICLKKVPVVKYLL